MIVFPNAKINLGLRIIRKRPDGFHDLETVFYPLPLRDALEILPAENSDTEPTIRVTGNSPDVPEQDNICIKAWKLLKTDHSHLPLVRMHLHKGIPSGAGLGGGSADASFLLQFLNSKFQLGITEERLAQYALTLGSDCPFFLKNIPVLATGRGEMLQAIPLRLTGHSIVIVNPGIHVSTAWAFGLIQPKEPVIDLATIITQPISSWADELINDFEKPVFSRYPEIAAIKERLLKTGAIYAAMSGSGSSVFGIFPANTAIEHEWPPHYFSRQVKLD